MTVSFHPNDVAGEESAGRKPLTALVRYIQDGRFLRVLFVGMLTLSVGTVGYDLRDMIANAPGAVPGSQRLEPAPMEPPRPGDQTRPYFPKTSPLSPSRGTPTLPGYLGPLDGSVMAQAMQFHIGPGGKVSAIGTITPGTAARLQAFLDENTKQIAELYLHSPGGSVSDALAMSRAVRKEGITTVVPKHGYCASSCPLVLSGGLYRKAEAPVYVGVHQVYAPPPATGTLQRGMSDAQTVSALCQQLLVEMGVDPKVWIFAMGTPSAHLYVFTPEQLRSLRLANGARARTTPTPRPLQTG